MRVCDSAKHCYTGWPCARRYALLLLAAVAVCTYLTCLPDPLFRGSYSSTIRAADGTLLSARIAADGQWRFPPADSLDVRYVRCVELFEDEYFRYHPGVNPVSIFRAFRQNLRAGRTVSGGSTLTQQTIRLMRGSPRRTIGEKLTEAIWATRLELTYSKEEILGFYAAHAPFGGNVVGVEAAAWRYYGRAATHLSWGEAAALAVLPNAPGVIFPGRSDAAFRRKRDGLLDKLHARGDLDAQTLALAKLEPLPGAPKPLPDLAPQLLLPSAPFQVHKKLVGAWGHDGRTSLDAGLQRTVTDLVERHRRRLSASLGVENAGVIVADVRTGLTLAYVGNASSAGPAHQHRVDVLQARRSSGSTLKPFLYAVMLDAGDLSPRTLLADVPTLIGDYAPRNFDHGFDGAVPASEALTRSLNIPWVRALRGFGVSRLRDKLEDSGLSTIDRGADDYGLSLILGGAEVTAWELAGAYRGLARTVQTYREAPRAYDLCDWQGLTLREADTHEDHGEPVRLGDAPVYSAAAAHLTLETLTELERPGDLAAWRSFGASRKVAWKTGTSFGMRDAWAVGVTPEYVVAVWTGNADGEGRPGLTGASAAAPLLFDVFDALPPTTWFGAPVADMRGVRVCTASGSLARDICPDTDTMLLPASAKTLALCPHHERVYVNDEGQRVDNTCASLATATSTVAFRLPASWASYYRRRHPGYRGVPGWAEGCAPAGEHPMQLLYPRGVKVVHAPRGLDGQRQAIAFEVAHEEPGAFLTWYVDGTWVGETSGRHVLSLRPEPGEVALVVVDERGRRARWVMTVER